VKAIQEELNRSLKTHTNTHHFLAYSVKRGSDGNEWRNLCEEEGGETETGDVEGSGEVAGSAGEGWVWCNGTGARWCNGTSWLRGVHWDLWDLGGGWLDGDGGVDDSWDAGRDGDDAQDWLAGWDNWLVNGGLRWVGWDEGGVVVDGWDGGGGEVRGGGGDGGSGWAVGDSWCAGGDGDNVSDIEG